MGRKAVDRDEGEGLLTGQLLIAMPMMDTPHFSQSVIYLCAHTPEGAMGIVVNRPLSRPSFDDLLEQLDVLPAPPVRRIELFRGGPVDSARGFVLHTSDWTGDGSLMVDDHVALTASLDVLKAIADGGGPTRGLLALGYAGWGPGQLDQEMQENAWLTAHPTMDILFDQDHETKWRRAMATLKVDPVLLSGTAGHA
jgi:putative transcriptional regulator